tara:strand:- start:366 stop:554 length:189 start_codon:yes stop_codon:yes gene_type:complete
MIGVPSGLIVLARQNDVFPTGVAAQDHRESSIKQFQDSRRELGIFRRTFVNLNVLAEPGRFR